MNYIITQSGVPADELSAYSNFQKDNEPLNLIALRNSHNVNVDDDFDDEFNFHNLPLNF